MKKSIALFCLAALAAGAFGTSAAEPAAASAPAAAPAAAPVETARQTPREGERSGRRMRGGAGFLERLREQYPNEVAEIEKLRESDPEAAGTKMRELMGKAGFGRRGRRGPENAAPAGESDEATLAKLKEKFPEEYAQYEELKKSDPEKAAAKLKELLEKAGLAQDAAASGSTLRDRSRRQLEMVNRELRRRDPEGYAHLEELRENDPDAARREFRRMVRETGTAQGERVDRVRYEYVPAPANNGGGRFNGRGGFPGGMPPWGGGFGGGFGGGHQRGR